MRKVQYAVAKVADVVTDRGQIVRLGESGGECALFLHEGRYYAVGSLCPHQNAPLEGAPAVRGEVICRRHGYRFELKSGDCVTLGGYGLPTFETSVVGDTIYVSVWEYD